MNLDENLKGIINFVNNNIRRGNPKKIDLILDGSGFLNYYVCGIVYYLIKSKRYHIDKISCASASVLGGIIICCELEDKILELMVESHARFHHIRTRENKNNWLLYLSLLKEHIPKDAYAKCSGRLFISYHKLTKTGIKHMTKSTFKNNEDLMETIKKTGFLPYFGSSKLVYKNEFLDGIYPNNLIFSSNQKIRVTCSNSIFYNIGDALVLGDKDFITKLIIDGIMDAYHFTVYGYSKSHVIKNIRPIENKVQLFMRNNKNNVHYLMVILNTFLLIRRCKKLKFRTNPLFFIVIYMFNFGYAIGQRINFFDRLFFLTIGELFLGFKNGRLEYGLLLLSFLAHKITMIY